MAVIYRQEIMQDILLFTSAPKARFYDLLFQNLDLSEFPESTAVTGRPGFSKRTLLRAFFVMKCECFEYITDLKDYLENNLIIAYYCGFNIMKPLPSYWTFDRFIRELDHSLLENLMQGQVSKLVGLGIIDSSFIALDSTPVFANTKQNNPKSFAKNRFDKNNQPKSDKDCKLGVHTASNQHNEKNYEFYWGYKNHVLVDCITGMPICEAGLAMHKDGKFSDRGRTRQKYCCPFKRLKYGSCPCNHKNWNNGKKNRGCTKYVTIPDDYRLSIDRESVSFKKIYALRTEAERYNSRFKATKQERLWVHGMNAAQNLNTIAHIALLAVAYAAVVTKSKMSYRSLKQVKRAS